jgi:hypothetical protein
LAAAGPLAEDQIVPIPLIVAVNGLCLLGGVRSFTFPGPALFVREVKI